MTVSANRLAARVLSVALLAAPMAVAGSSEAADLSRVVASRGTATVTLGDIDAKVRSMPPELRSGYLREPDRIARLIESMLLSAQIASEAKAAGLHQDVEFLDDLKLLETELLAGRQVRAQAAAVEPPDFEMLARERYLADPKVYADPARIDLRHILFSTDGRDEEVARSMAVEAMERLQKGEAFADVANAYIKPDDRSVSSDLIKDADVKRLDPRFAAALAEMDKPGAIAGPVRSRFGYHVIRLESLEQPAPPPWDEVKERIIEGLRAEFLTNERNRYLAKFSNLPFELDGDVIRSLPGRYVDASTGEATSAQQPGGDQPSAENTPALPSPR